MGEALAETVKRLAQLPLPALKENLQRIRQLASSDGSDMGEIADIVESDLGLSVLLLGHLNTSRHRQNRHPVTNARHALMMMGLEPLRQLLPRVVVAEEQCDEGVQQQLRGLYCRAFHAAHQAIAIARARNDYDEEELASAAQLAHIGRAMRMVHEGSARNALDEMALSQQLAHTWNLPHSLYDEASEASPLYNRGHTIRLATAIAREAEHGWYHPEMNQVLEQLAELLRSDEASAATLVHQGAVMAARLSAIYRIPHPAAQLIYPAVSPDVVKPVNKAARTTAADSTPAAARCTCLTPQPQLLAAAIKRLQQQEQPLSARDLIPLVTGAMQEGLGLNRVVFAIPKEGRLRAAQLLDSSGGSRFKQFSIELDGHNLFSRLLEKQQSLWLGDSNRKKFFSLIPVNFHQLIDNDSFFVMSLLVHNKPIGIFYADRASKQCPLDEASYRRFKQLVQLTAAHLLAIKQQASQQVAKTG